MRTEAFQKACNDAGVATKRFSKEFKGSMEESRGSLVLLGDQIGVAMPRELSRFISKLPGVSEAMSAAFSAVAVVALINVIVDAGEKLDKFITKNQEAAEKNKQAWDESTRSLQEQTDELSLSTLKIKDHIALLEHKPAGNGIAEAMLEARVEAEKLDEKLLDIIKNEAQLIKEQAPSMWAQYFGNAGHDTGAEQEMLTQHEKWMGMAATPDAQLKESQSFGTVLQTRLAKLQNQQEHPDALSVSGNNFTAEIDSLKQMIARQQMEESLIKSSMDNIAAANKEKALEDAENHKKDASDQGNKVFEQAKERLDALQAVSNQTIQDQIKYWQGIEKQLGSASVAGHKAHEEAIRLQGDQTRQTALQNQQDFGDMVLDMVRQQLEKTKSQTPQNPTDYAMGLQKEDDDAAKQNKEAARLQFQAAMDQINADEKLAEQTIALAVQRGQLTQSEAALQYQQLHLAAQQKINAAVTTASGAGAMTLPEATRISAGAAEQNQADQNAIILTDTTNRVIDSLNQLANAFTDTAKQISELLTSGLNGVNDQLVKGLMGKRTNFGQVGSDFFQNVSKDALQQGEGRLLKGLGLGGKKADGSQSNPFYVKNVGSKGSGSNDSASNPLLNWANDNDTMGKLFGGKLFGPGGIFDQQSSAGSSGSGSGSGGIFSSLFGNNASDSGGDDSSGGLGSMFGGGFATGGDVAGNIPIMTGEMGPEIFMPSTAGKIIPHNQAFGTTQHISIDARGSNDPAATQAAIHNAMASYLPHLAKASVAAQRDNARRKPSGR